MQHYSKKCPWDLKTLCYQIHHWKSSPVKSLTFEENTREPDKYNVCFLRTLALLLQRIEKLEEETSKIFKPFTQMKTGGTDHTNFWGVSTQDIAPLQVNVRADIFLYNLEVIDESMIGELAGRIVGRHPNTARLLSWKIYICSVSNINALFKAYRCISCDDFIRRAQYLERHLTLDELQRKS